LNPLTLGQWLRLGAGAKLRSIISGHLYEVVARVDDPFQKSYDWRIPAFITTEGRRITFSRLWRLESEGESDSIPDLQSELVGSESVTPE
jgi:hypothetical protein